MIPESQCRTPVKPKRTIRKHIRVQKAEMPPNQLAVDDMYDIVSVDDSVSNPIFNEETTYTRDSNNIYTAQIPIVDIGFTIEQQEQEQERKQKEEEDADFVPATPERRPSLVKPNAPKRRRHVEIVSPITLPPPFRSKWTGSKSCRNLHLDTYQERCYQQVLEQLTNPDDSKLRIRVLDMSVYAPDEFTDVYLTEAQMMLVGVSAAAMFRYRCPLDIAKEKQVNMILPSCITTQQFVRFIGVTLSPYHFDNQMEFNTVSDVLHVAHMLQATEVYNRAERFILANAAHMTQLDLLKCLVTSIKLNKLNRALMIRCIEVMLFDETKDQVAGTGMLTYLRTKCSLNLKAALCELHLIRDRADPPERFSITDDVKSFESSNEQRILAALENCQVINRSSYN
jgi:hypothetical protein